MNKSKTKSIIYSLGILAVLVFGIMTVPTQSYAITCGEGGCDSYAIMGDVRINRDNPEPIINSISPSSSNPGVGVKTVTITGSGFVPGSVSKINGSNRATTFIDSSHLLIQITGSDIYTYLSNGGFFITVFNPAPGGGYSNATFFTINNNGISTAATANIAGDTSTNFTDTTSTENKNRTDKNYSSLASNAIFGTRGSATPSGLIQWIFFAILVLLIVILVRKVLGGKEKYDAKPMKHD